MTDRLSEEEKQELRKKAEAFMKSSKGQEKLRKWAAETKKILKELQKQRRIPDRLWLRRIGPIDRPYW